MPYRRRGSHLGHHTAGQSGEIALMAEPVWQFRLSDGNEPLFSVPVRTQGCQTFPNAHPWASHPIALGGVVFATLLAAATPGHLAREAAAVSRLLRVRA